MRKLLLSAAVIALTFTACEKEPVQVQEVETSEVAVQSTDAGSVATSQSNTSSSRKKTTKKVDVCHNGNIINVSVNALKAFVAQGDAVDADGDGFFNKENSCSEGVDCDDTDASVNPGAEEVYGNDVDENCNGVVGWISLSQVPVPCTGCTKGQGYWQNAKGKCKGDITSFFTKGGFTKCYEVIEVKVDTYNFE